MNNNKIKSYAISVNGEKICEFTGEMAARSPLNKCRVISDQEYKERRVEIETSIEDIRYFSGIVLVAKPAKIDRVMFRDPATIVFWTDGTKTVVKTSPRDTYDKEKGILWAFIIKNSDLSKNQVQKMIRKFVEADSE